MIICQTGPSPGRHETIPADASGEPWALSSGWQRAEELTGHVGDGARYAFPRFAMRQT